MSVSSDSEHLTSEDEKTVEVNGFEVPISKENQVKEMFKNHPDLSSNVNVEDQNLNNIFMEVLLDVIETQSQSTNVLSWKDIINVHGTHLALTKAGFKVNWLRKRLVESIIKKEKQLVSGARIKRLKKQIKKQKLKLSDLESDLKREKAASTALAKSFD